MPPILQIMLRHGADYNNSFTLQTLGTFCKLSKKLVSQSVLVIY